MARHSISIHHTQNKYFSTESISSNFYFYLKSILQDLEKQNKQINRAVASIPIPGGCTLHIVKNIFHSNYFVIFAIKKFPLEKKRSQK